MGKPASPYYPPRARWPKPLFNFGAEFRRRLFLDRIKIPAGVSLREFIGCLMIPGLAFYLRGPRFVGKAVLAGCALLIAIFFVGLGFPVANIAFGLLLSTHATSLNYLFNPWITDARLGFRIVLSLAILIALGCFLYWPLRGVMEKHFLVPLRVNGHVIVARRIFAAHLVKRGDWIAYEVSSERARGTDGGVQLQSGFGIGPVLAEAGDRVTFNEKTFEVNGVSHPLLPHMPTSGAMIIKENHWFVWPELAISGGHGNVPEANITAVMMELGTIAKDDMTGWKPFKHWFWRRQFSL